MLLHGNPSGHFVMTSAKSRGATLCICAVPKPFRIPYPPVFSNTGNNRGTIEFCAKQGFDPSCFMPHR